jgi:hypothetical protein
MNVYATAVSDTKQQVHNKVAGILLDSEARQ